MASRPVVLMVDDDPDSIEPQAAALSTAFSIIRKAPSDVTATDLRRAHVALIDYSLRDWPERDRQESIAFQPQNGVALASTLRSYADEFLQRRPKAYAIHSGRLTDLSGGLPTRGREHAIARAANLEWVFLKGPGGLEQLISKVKSLATGMSRFPSTWPTDLAGGSSELTKLLALSATQLWAGRAEEDVKRCSPPAHSAAVATRGHAVARWLLHQILPYPTFLLDKYYLAARLFVTADSLEEALRDRAATKAISSALYRGAFAGFLGPRWWRAGVEHLLWEWTKGAAFDRDAVLTAVRRRFGDVAEVDQRRPVVLVDDDSFRPTSEVADLSEVVQVQPDDWPVYAEQAWMIAAEAIDDAELRVLIPAVDAIDNLREAEDSGG